MTQVFFSRAQLPPINSNINLLQQKVNEINSCAALQHKKKRNEIKKRVGLFLSVVISTKCCSTKLKLFNFFSFFLFFFCLATYISTLFFILPLTLRCDYCIRKLRRVTVKFVGPKTTLFSTNNSSCNYISITKEEQRKYCVCVHNSSFSIPNSRL